MQFDLFGGSAAAQADAADHPVRPADVPAHVKALGAALPRNARFGTSSWAFEGWRGVVYDAAAKPRELSAHGLWAYAQHPLFSAVGLDRTHYAPIDADTYRAYAAAVPPHFRFLVKAHDHLSLARFFDHPRYGSRRGLPNPRFLDADYMNEVVLGPTWDGLGEKAGVVLLQFAAQSEADLGDAARFAERLDGFLARLDRRIPLAIEVRNRRLLSRMYRDVLAAHDVSHCIVAIPDMPSVRIQRRLAHLGPQTVTRWMLARGRSYAEAKASMAPFTKLAVEDGDTREDIVDVISESTAAERPTITIVNNKAEGCSPRSIARLAERLLGR